jgi:hypothetical protein
VAKIIDRQERNGGGGGEGVVVLHQFSFSFSFYYLGRGVQKLNESSTKKINQTKKMEFFSYENFLYPSDEGPFSGYTV